MNAPRPSRRRQCALAALLAGLFAASLADAQALPAESVATLGRSLEVGDIVFTRIGAYPFRKVAEATGTWTNHVGIVLDVSGPEPHHGDAAAVAVAAAQRAHVFYDTGFDIHSSRQFCSRYVREVLLQATGQPVGQVESFSSLLAHSPQADVGFWRAWYFGSIPWQRETVTPASVLRTPGLQTVFDGTAV